MYNKIWKKGFVLGVIAVFVFMSIAPSSNGRLITPKNTAFSTCEDHPCADIVVSITYPETAVYMNGQKLFPFFVPLILHGVTYVLTVIETTVEIERVEFWINGVLQFVDDAVPFDGFFPFEANPLSRTEVTVYAYTLDGAQGSDSIVIWRIFS